MMQCSLPNLPQSTSIVPAVKKAVAHDVFRAPMALDHVAGDGGVEAEPPQQRQWLSPVQRKRLEEHHFREGVVDACLASTRGSRQPRARGHEPIPGTDLRAHTYRQRHAQARQHT